MEREKKSLPETSIKAGFLAWCAIVIPTTLPKPNKRIKYHMKTRYWLPPDNEKYNIKLSFMANEQKSLEFLQLFSSRYQWLNLIRNTLILVISLYTDLFSHVSILSGYSIVFTKPYHLKHLNSVLDYIGTFIYRL